MKFSRIAVAVVLVISLLTSTVFAASPLSDISAHWANEGIEDFISKGYVSGYSDGTFRPDAAVSRAEFMRIINAAYGLTEKAAISFTDVTINDWFNGEIKKAKAAGYIEGYEDNTMRPNNLITRQEAALIFQKLKKLTADESAVEVFLDKDTIGTWAKGAVGSVTKAAIMSGYPDKTFMPNNFITRAETVTVARNSLLIALDDSKIPLATPVVPVVIPAKTGGGGSGDGSSTPPAVNMLSADPSGGSVHRGTELGLSTSTVDAAIRYTFGDGTQTSPTEGTGAVYDTVTKIKIDSTGTYKVKAFKSGMTPSAELAASYVVVDSITGTAYDDADRPLGNKTLTFTSDTDTYQAQTDRDGYFWVHIRVGKQYEVSAERLSSKVNSDGLLGGVSVINTTGKIVLGKVLTSASNVVVLQPGTIYLDQSYGAHVTYDPATGVAVFDTPMDFVPGDIILLPPTTEYPGGLAVKVLRAAVSNGTTTIHTVKPEIKEVFKSIKGSTFVTLEDGVFIPEPGVGTVTTSSPEVLLANSGRGLINSASVSKTIAIHFGDPDDPNGAAINGSVKLTGSMTGDIDWDWEVGVVDSFDFKIDGEQVFIGDVTYTNTATANRVLKKKLGVVHIPTNIPGITTDFEYWLFVTPEGTCSVGFETTTSEIVGVKYDDENGMSVYPEEKLQATGPGITVVTPGGVKTGFEILQDITAAGLNITGINEKAGFYAEPVGQIIDPIMELEYGAFVAADVEVGLARLNFPSVERKFKFGTWTLGGDQIKDLKITPTYMDISPGTSKTFTLMVQDNADEWNNLTEAQFADLTFQSSNPKITHLGRGEVKVADDATSDTSTVTFKIRDFTKTATVKIVTDSGTLQGVVKDALTNAPLQGASVTIYDGDLDVDKRVTTSATGQFSILVPVGVGYHVIVEMPGYLSEMYQNIDIDVNASTNLETIMQIDSDHSGVGIVSGKIVNATDGSGVTGLTITLRKGINVREGQITTTTETTIGGNYIIEGLAAGNYTAEIGGDGYNTGYFTIVCLGGMTKSGQNATVTGNLADGQTRVVLTWGEIPADLDSHLTGPTGTGSRYHIYYSNKVYLDEANLDLDDTTSYGPETTTIIKQNDGTYRFYVYDYTNRSSTSAAELSNSGATVKVYRQDQLVATYYVPASQVGVVWTVFELNGSSIIPINQISSDYSSISSLSMQSQDADDGDMFSNLPDKGGLDTESAVQDSEVVEVN